MFEYMFGIIISQIFDFAILFWQIHVLFTFNDLKLIEKGNICPVLE